MTGQDVAGRWQAAMERADTELLDCLAVNLAVLLAWHGAADVRTPFAARWRFRLRDDAAGGSRLDLPPQDLAEDLRELAGWELRWRPAANLAGQLPAWASSCDEDQPVLVVADAFDMPWVPYAGHEHMEHSFIVAAVDRGCLTITDGYANTTEWGAAQPVTATVGPAEIASLLAGAGRWSAPRQVGLPAAAGCARSLAPTTIARLVRESADEICTAHEAGRYEFFLRQAATLAQAGDLAPVAVDSWLLARSRRLHARWLDKDAAACVPVTLRQDFGASVAAAWTRAAEISYIGLRRARSGRAVPPAVIDCLRQACSAEHDLARVIRDGSRPDAVTAQAHAAPGGALRC
jgi:hypothetical protein